VLFALIRGRSIGVVLMAIAIIAATPFLAGYGLLGPGEGIEDIFSFIQILLGSDH